MPAPGSAHTFASLPEACWCAGLIAVTETLTGQQGAFFAIVFASITMLVTTVQCVTPGGFGPGYWVIYSIPIGVGVVELLLILLIIHRTWRMTLLTVRFNELRLNFSSPLYRKHHSWTGDEIADMLLAITANNETEMPLAELLITRCTGGEIHLFTDHRVEELSRMAAMLPPMLREPPPAIAVRPDLNPWQAANQTVVNPGEGAAETANRLVELHRGLRNKSK